MAAQRSDSLGSPRVITNSIGGVVSRHDYMRFGVELHAGVGGRTTSMGFSNSVDNNRKKFTEQERDDETGMDYKQWSAHDDAGLHAASNVAADKARHKSTELDLPLALELSDCFFGRKI